MRKTKRVVSLLITVAMMLTMVLPMTVSAAFSDVPATHNYYDAITNLSAEGILDGMGDGTFKPEDPVTRAQFTKIICYALSVGNITYSEEERSIFTDLAPNHWAANNIVQAYKQGIINGMGDGTFAPEAGVQYEQAVKMVVCALGYGNRALSLGAYPNGYMSMANQLKILNGITDAKMYQVMNRGAVAQLIDNMLDAEQLQDGQPSGSIRDEVSTTEKAEGRVVASKNIALYADYDNPCGNDEIAVEVGNKTVVFDISEIKNFDINKFLGRSVTVHYEKESGSSLLMATNVALQSKKNEEVTINLDLIEDYGSGEIEYYTSADRDDTEIATYGATANIFNGAPTEETLEDLLDENVGKSGTITLISSSRGVADVAFIKSYVSLIVSSVSAKDNKIYSGYELSCASGFVLNVDSRSKTITIKSKAGVDIPIGSIASGSVLSIAASDTEGSTLKERIESSSVVEVIVCTESIKGTIEATSSNPRTIRINGKDYVVPDTACGTNNATLSALTAGAYVSVGFDAFGQVAKFTITEKSSLNYGYISQLEHGTYTSPEVRVMVYKPSTASSNKPSSTVYTLARRVDIDGTRYNMEEDMEDIVEYLDDAADYVNADFDSDITPSRDTYAQPIRFTTSGSNVIDKIITVKGTVGGAISNSLLMSDYTDDGGITCMADGTTLGQYRISGVPVLYIPADRKSADYATMSSSFFKKDKSYYVQLANINSNTNVVGAIYLYGDAEGGDIATDITEDSKPLMVLAKGTKDVNGTVKSYLTLKNIVNGEEGEYYNEGLTGTEALNTLVVGDVIRISADGENNIEKVQVVAIAAQVAAGTYGDSDSWIITDGDGEGLDADFRILIGTVRTKEGNNFTVVPGYNTADTTKVEGHSASVIPYIVDTDANENIRIDTGVVADLQVGANGSRVLIYMEENVIKALVIFE